MDLTIFTTNAKAMSVELDNKIDSGIKNFLELQARELLEEFGAGSHKPGSGSAAALQGLLSAQLIRTVINRTVCKDAYKEWHEPLNKLDKEIEKEVYPTLLKLFQEDSEVFHTHMNARLKARDESDYTKRRHLKARALDKLKPATEIPIQIAWECIKLAEGAKLIFDHGFTAVRGDSGVALNSSVSALGGCLSVIDLNLTYFPDNDWTRDIRQKTSALHEKHIALTNEVNRRLDNLKKEADWKMKLNSFTLNSFEESKLSFSYIENLVSRFQNFLWVNRMEIWDEENMDPLDILKPQKAFEVLGYTYDTPLTLGQQNIDGKVIEIAGVISKSKKIVKISSQKKPYIQNFTAAHELGHALLHNQDVLHRDGPLDGSKPSNPRNPQETQADKFAAFFLMPKKQVLRIFGELYGTSQFVINEETVFALGEKSIRQFRDECKNLRGLSKFLSSNTFYHRNFKSLKEIFGVSEGAMA